MAKKIIPESELIINPDGSVFHIHLRPEQLTDRIILVGDPCACVDMVASFFDTKTFEVSSREFHTIGGTYTRASLSCVCYKPRHRPRQHRHRYWQSLMRSRKCGLLTTREVRATTSVSSLWCVSVPPGALQPGTPPLGTPVIAEKSIRFRRRTQLLCRPQTP